MIERRVTRVKRGQQKWRKWPAKKDKFQVSATAILTAENAALTHKKKLFLCNGRIVGQWPQEWPVRLKEKQKKEKKMVAMSCWRSGSGQINSWREERKKTGLAVAGKTVARGKLRKKKKRATSKKGGGAHRELLLSLAWAKRCCSLQVLLGGEKQKLLVPTFVLLPGRGECLSKGSHWPEISRLLQKKKKLHLQTASFLQMLF